MAIIKTHPHSLDEILVSINASSDVVAALKVAFKESYFKGYIELAVSDTWTTLDIDTIEIKKYGYDRSLAGAFLLNRQTWNIVSSVIMVESVNDITKAKQFKALSEMLYIDESAVLNAILQKNITSLYPNIAFELLNIALNDAN